MGKANLKNNTETGDEDRLKKSEKWKNYSGHGKKIPDGLTVARAHHHLRSLPLPQAVNELPNELV